MAYKPSISLSIPSTETTETTQTATRTSPLVQFFNQTNTNNQTEIYSGDLTIEDFRRLQNIIILRDKEILLLQAEINSMKNMDAKSIRARKTYI